MDKIKKFFVWLGIILVAGILLAMIIPMLIPQRPVVDEYINSLEKENDSLENVNIQNWKNFRADSLIADSIGKSVAKEKVKIIYLNNNRDAKIKIVDNLSDDELDNFFAGIKPKARKDSER